MKKLLMILGFWISTAVYADANEEFSLNPAIDLLLYDQVNRTELFFDTFDSDLGWVYEFSDFANDGDSEAAAEIENGSLILSASGGQDFGASVSATREFSTSNETTNITWAIDIRQIFVSDGAINLRLSYGGIEDGIEILVSIGRLVPQGSTSRNLLLFVSYRDGRVFGRLNSTQIPSDSSMISVTSTGTNYSGAEITALASGEDIFEGTFGDSDIDIRSIEAFTFLQ